MAIYTVSTYFDDLKNPYIKRGDTNIIQTVYERNRVRIRLNPRSCFAEVVWTPPSGQCAAMAHKVNLLYLRNWIEGCTVLTYCAQHVTWFTACELLVWVTSCLLQQAMLWAFRNVKVAIPLCLSVDQRSVLLYPNIIRGLLFRNHAIFSSPCDIGGVAGNQWVTPFRFAWVIRNLQRLSFDVCRRAGRTGRRLGIS